MDQTEQMRSVVSWMISGGALDEDAPDRPARPFAWAGSASRMPVPFRDRLQAAFARVAPARADRPAAADCAGC